LAELLFLEVGAGSARAETAGNFCESPALAAGGVFEEGISSAGAGKGGNSPPFTFFTADPTTVLDLDLLVEKIVDEAAFSSFDAGIIFWVTVLLAADSAEVVFLIVRLFPALSVVDCPSSSETPLAARGLRRDVPELLAATCTDPVLGFATTGFAGFTAAPGETVYLLEAAVGEG